MTLGAALITLAILFSPAIFVAVTGTVAAGVGIGAIGAASPIAIALAVTLAAFVIATTFTVAWGITMAVNKIYNALRSVSTDSTDSTEEQVEPVVVERQKHQLPKSPSPQSPTKGTALLDWLFYVGKGKDSANATSHTLRTSHAPVKTDVEASKETPEAAFKI